MTDMESNYRRRQRAQARKYRADKDHELLDYLKEFVRLGTPEEKRLMYDVMEVRESSTHYFSQPEEIGLLSAFEIVIRDTCSGPTVFRVPEGKYHDFVDYLKWLKANEKTLSSPAA